MARASAATRRPIPATSAKDAPARGARRQADRSRLRGPRSRSARPRCHGPDAPGRGGRRCDVAVAPSSSTRQTSSRSSSVKPEDDPPSHSGSPRGGRRGGLPRRLLPGRANVRRCFAAGAADGSWCDEALSFMPDGDARAASRSLRRPPRRAGSAPGGGRPQRRGRASMSRSSPPLPRARAACRR